MEMKDPDPRENGDHNVEGLRQPPDESLISNDGSRLIQGRAHH